MVWYTHLSKSFPQFVMIHIVKGLSTVDEREVDVFLKLPCFLYDPANVDNLTSSSSSFSKTDFSGGSDGKASAYNAGDPGLIPGSGRSSGEGNGNPLQYSCLENPMDGEV